MRLTTFRTLTQLMVLVSVVLLTPLVVSGQTPTYYLHGENGSNYGTFALKTIGPDTGPIVRDSGELKNRPPASNQSVGAWTSAIGVPGLAGVIPAETVITFTLWMRKTSNNGTVFPFAQLQTVASLDVNLQVKANVCAATGETALDTTIRAYSFTCQTSTPVPVDAIDRWLLWAGYSMTQGPGNKSMKVELYFEGTRDSHVQAPNPTAATLTDGTLWVDIDVNRGGAITNLKVLNNQVLRTNIIDNGDATGRQLQASLYNGTWDPNCWPCNPNPACYWGWNPVQAGNACQAQSGGTVVEVSATRIVTQSTPLQWSNLLGRSNIVLRQTAEIVQPWVLRLDYQVTNNETFAVGNFSLHELPVAYLATTFYNGSAYTGVAPWTYDQVTAFPVPPLYTNVTTTEPWIAMSDVDGWTVALYVPNNYEHWTIGFKADPTANLLQALQTMELAPGETKTATAYLVAAFGLTDVRQRIYALAGY